MAVVGATEISEQRPEGQGVAWMHACAYNQLSTFLGNDSQSTVDKSGEARVRLNGVLGNVSRSIEFGHEVRRPPELTAER